MIDICGAMIGLAICLAFAGREARVRPSDREIIDTHS